MPGRGEMVDVVVDEIGRRQAQALAARGAVEGGRDAQLHAFRPDGVVIVVAVDAERVVPHRKPCRVGVVGRRRHLARHVAAEHPDFRAQLADDEFELDDRLLGGAHRDDRRRGHPLFEAAEIICRNDGHVPNQ
jgi:hypothetical protein